MINNIDTHLEITTSSLLDFLISALFLRWRRKVQETTYFFFFLTGGTGNGTGPQLLSQDSEAASAEERSQIQIEVKDSGDKPWNSPQDPQDTFGTVVCSEA